jgi:hypothetical protein
LFGSGRRRLAARIFREPQRQVLDLIHPKRYEERTLLLLKSS